MRLAEEGGSWNIVCGGVSEEAYGLFIVVINIVLADEFTINERGSGFV